MIYGGLYKQNCNISPLKHIRRLHVKDSIGSVISSTALEMLTPGCLEVFDSPQRTSEVHHGYNAGNTAANALSLKAHTQQQGCG